MARFVVERVRKKQGQDKPCKNAIERKITYYLDDEDNTEICEDMWVVEINSIDDLLDFVSTNGVIVVSDYPFYYVREEDGHLSEESLCKIEMLE